MFEQWLESGNLTAQEVRNGKRAPPPGDYSKGRWIRTLNAQETCYLYIHTTTYQMQGTRPEDFISEGDDGPKVVGPRAHLGFRAGLPQSCAPASAKPDGALSAGRWAARRWR